MIKHLVTAQGSTLPTGSQIAANFGDLHAPLGLAQAEIEANECLYCYDAPCVRACPTAINIPLFIQQISTGNIEGSARTILSANILGGTCARACPTEVLCEGACVVNRTKGAPVKIGLLQRAAVDHELATATRHPFARAAATGKRLAVIGAGPAGLSFAHRAAGLGHEVTIYEARPKPGGLNEYGLAAYKMIDDFAQREVDFVLGIGGITIRYGMSIGRDLTLDDLRLDHDAVFIGVGLSHAARAELPGTALTGVSDALSFIERLRQAADKTSVAVGRQVVVIGGGNTAIDAAVQARALGAASVTLVYRRGAAEMSATGWEQDLARVSGVEMRFWSTPLAFEGDAVVTHVHLAETAMVDGRLAQTGRTERLPADQVLLAIGQQLEAGAASGLRTERGKIWIDGDYQTSISGVFAGGDAVAIGDDLTVQAVEDGKRAAIRADALLRLGVL